MSNQAVDAETTKEARDDVLSPPSFVTVSGVLDRLNQEISKYVPSHARESAPPRYGRFELQTRVADGSARPATRDEVASADADTMLHQAAAHVQTLPTWSHQLAWAHAQRLVGHERYEARQYQAALDIYLTCLTVAAVECEANDTSTRATTMERWLLFGQVLNNLALCAYQLGWHKKTIHFCTIAIDYYQSRIVENVAEQEDSMESSVRLLAGYRSKLYFQRARAHRLRGDFTPAQQDLIVSRQWLKQTCATSDATSDAMVATDKPRYDRCDKTLQREERLWHQAVAASVRSRKQQQQAMQSWLNDASSNRMTAPRNTNDPTEHAKSAPRLYSTIRAEANGVNANGVTPHAANETDTPVTPSYWQMYWWRVGRQAQRLVDWMDERERQRDKRD